MAGAGNSDTTAVRAASRGLLGAFSIEVTPPELARRPDLRAVLAPDTRVYITYLPKVPFSDVIRGAGQVRESGLRPVVHLAARSVASLSLLDRMLGELAEVGVADVLLIAGSVADPAGDIEDTIQVLESPVFLRREFTSIGVAGHPEGNPGVDPATVDAALATKNKIAATHGLPMYLVTQFCFAAEPVIAWERRVREMGNLLPVHVGLPGLTSPAKLVKFGLACGVGPSLAVLRKQTGGVLKLARTPVYHPDETLIGLAGERLRDPASLLHNVHFFAFGAITATAEWAGAVRDGRFAIGGRGRRLTVTT